MILELPLIAGTVEEIFNHILDLESFEMWMPGKDFKDQIKIISENKWRVGPIMYFTRSAEGRGVNARWVVITTPNGFFNS